MPDLAESGRVYVLGAGASVFADYPLASGLLRYIRNLRTVDATTKDVASNLFTKLDTNEMLYRRHIFRDLNKEPNLEELLTYLEMYHCFQGTISANDPWNSRDSASIRRVITERFLGHQYDLAKKVWETGQPNGPLSADIDRIRKIGDVWSTLVRPGDVILTFNWDILHEVVLWRSGLWSYRDGYGFQCGDQGNRDDRSPVLMLKLHGSVNWVQEDDSDPVSEIANVPDFFYGAKDWDWRPHHSQAQTDSGRKLVLPTYQKDISSNAVLLKVWATAQKILAQAKELIVIGYSLNPADHPARLLLGTALSLNENLSHVTVVSLDTRHWDDTLRRLGKRMIRIPRRFEDWVLSTSSKPNAEQSLRASS